MAARSPPPAGSPSTPPAGRGPQPDERQPEEAQPVSRLLRREVGQAAAAPGSVGAPRALAADVAAGASSSTYETLQKKMDTEVLDKFLNVFRGK